MTARLLGLWLIAFACTLHNLAAHDGPAWSNVAALAVFTAVEVLCWRQGRRSARRRSR